MTDPAAEEYLQSLKMKAVFIALVGLGPLAGATALAQPSGTEDLVDLDGDGDVDEDDRALLEAAEVISIEDKSEATRLVESARAVTVVDLRKARERAADLGEVMSRAHGIQVRRSGGLGSATRFSLNGLYDEQIRFFVDGIPLSLAGWGLGIANIPVDQIQRVDVYRGVVPIGLGADALGGAIDLVTDPSWVDRASASYQVGSFGTHRGSIGARVRDDATGAALGMSLFVDRATNDYEVEVEVPDDLGRPVPTRVRRFHDAYQAGGAIIEGGLVQRGPIERALVRVFQAQYAKELQHNLVMAIPYGEAAYAGDSRGVALDVVLARGPWRGRLVLGGARTHTDLRDVGTGVYDWHGQIVRERARPGEIGTRPVDQRIHETSVFARATLERALGEAHTLRLAIAPTITDRRGTDFLDTNPDGRDSIEARRELAQLVTGIEHEVSARGGRLENIAFAKLYRSAMDAELEQANFQFVPVSERRSRFGVGDSLRYKLTDQLVAKASYEWATRMPSVEELFGDGVLIDADLELVPETSHNANLGLQLARETRTGAWAGEVAAFGRLVENMIFLLPLNPRSVYRNVAGVHVLGAEGSFGWVAPGEWASLTANATVQDIRNASSEGTFGRFEGDRVPNRPWLLGSLDASVRRRDNLLANDELTLFASSRYVHEFFRGWESAGQRDSKQVVEAQLVHGLGVTYAIRGKTPIATTLELQNLTDARAYDSYGVLRPGRAVYLKISAEL